MPLVDHGDIVPVQSHSARAARWAVLTPCCGAEWRQRPFPQMMKHLRHLWQRRVSSLADVLTDPIRADTYAGRLAGTYWKNCPPFSTVTPPKTLRCSKRLICPFCYARDYVIKTMQVCQAALYDRRRRQPVPLAALDETILVDFTTSIRFVSASDRNWQTRPGRVAATMELVRNVVTRNKRDESAVMGHLGGVVLQRLQFEAESWTLLRSGVFLCNARDYDRRPVPPDTERETRLVRVSSPTRENLARAVGRAFRYPDSVLVTAPEIVREYVQQLKGVNMWQSYGILRDPQLQSKKRN